MKYNTLVFSALLPVYTLATAWAPPQYGIIEFFNHLDKGQEEEGAKILAENLAILPRTTKEEKEALIHFLIDYANKRYQLSLTFEEGASFEEILDIFQNSL